MPHNRYYIPKRFEAISTLEIEGQEFHHLTRVMRQNTGDEIEIVNGQGQLALAEVGAIHKAKAIVTLLSLQEEQPSTQRLALALAFQRHTHLEFAVEKAVEIGVHRFVLFPGKRSDKKEYSEHNIERLQNIIISATKQCGRLFLPDLCIKKSMQDSFQESSFNLHGTFENAKAFNSLQDTLAQKNDVTLYIGPESGFTEDEIVFLESKKSCGISLSKNILRAETAAIVGAALVLNAISKNE